MGLDVVDATICSALPSCRVGWLFHLLSHLLLHWRRIMESKGLRCFGQERRGPARHQGLSGVSIRWVHMHFMHGNKRDDTRQGKLQPRMHKEGLTHTILTEKRQILTFFNYSYMRLSFLRKFPPFRRNLLDNFINFLSHFKIFNFRLWVPFRMFWSIV